MNLFASLRTALVPLAFVTLGPTAARAGGPPLVLSFGVYTSDKPTVMYGMFKPLLVHLEREVSRELGCPVTIKLRIFKSYDGANDALVEGKVDFVRFGPASYVISKERNPGISLLAIEEGGGENPRRFNGVILVRDASAIREPADLKGRSFAFGDETSTIGRYLSQAYLLHHGIRARDLEHFEYLGRHDLVVTAVLHGKFDAGAAKEGTFKKYRDQGLRALATFENVTKPWVARARLDELRPGLTEALRGALLSLEDPEILKNVSDSLTGFGRVEDSEYDLVREGMKESARFVEPLAGSSPGEPQAATRDEPQLQGAAR